METIYTFGYQGRKVDDLKAAAEELDAIVVDVRHSPFSRDREWSKWGLAKSLAGRYVHLPEYGNVNYKGGPILLKDAKGGTAKLSGVLATKNLILLCACWNQPACHRTVAAETLSEATGASVIHLRKKAEPVVEKVDEQGSLF